MQGNQPGCSSFQHRKIISFEALLFCGKVYLTTAKWPEFTVLIHFMPYCVNAAHTDIDEGHTHTQNGPHNTSFIVYIYVCVH